MLSLSIIKEMETMDCLRSAALVIGMTAILFGTSRASGSRKRNDCVGIWLLGESIFLGVAGMGVYLFPETVIGHVTDGKLDVFHLFSARGMGAVMCGYAVISYMMRESANRNMWLAASMLSGVAVFLTMFMGHMSPVKKGTVKFNNKHVTFGLLACALWVMSTLCVLSRQTYIGNRTRGVRVVNKMDRHLLIDLVFAVLDIIMLLGYPALDYSFVIAQNFVPNHLHYHISRTMGCLCLAPIFLAVTNFQSGDRHDKRAHGFGRLMMFMLGCPLMLWYSWWYPFLSVESQIGMWSFTILAMINLAVA